MITTQGSTSPSPSDGVEPEEQLFEGWGKYLDEDNNVFYYFNVDSGESTYQRPEDFRTMNDPFAAIVNVQ
jgi:hypothetical protein